MPEGEKLEKESNESEGFGRVGRAMDTPNRNQINTPLSKVEDSPFFNYINSLSPIKTIKSTHISQTFSSFNFATVPSVFTSPQISSLKEARFLKRHHFSDPSMLEFSSRNEDKGGAIESVMDVTHNLDEQQEYFDPRSCIGEAEPTYECSELATDVSEMLVYDCGGPDGSASPCHGTGTNYGPDLAGTLDTDVPSAQEAPESGFLGSGVQLESSSMTEENREGAGRDLENISDVAGLLMFDLADEGEAFKGHFQKQPDSEKTRLHISLISELAHDEGAQSFVPDVVELCEPENPPSEVEEEGCPMEIEATGDILVSTCTHTHAAEKSEQFNNESVSALHCGIRKRCLFFETGGACKKHLNDSCSCCSSLSRSDVESNDKQLVPVKASNESSCCILPGIGLHLNALARTSTSKKYIISSHELLTTDKEYVDKSLAVASVDIDIIPFENRVEEIKDASQASGYMANEEINQCSPKTKRRKLENAVESEDWKRCNCKKSKCLKLYCECFAAGLYCAEPCSCQDCLNKPVYQDTVLSTRKQIESRNPLAFAPKVIRSSDSLPVIGDESSKTPASARHKRGCNCKKSGCLKKYCECYQGGVGCSINCRCEGCKNAFGTKDGEKRIQNVLEEDQVPEILQGHCSPIKSVSPNSKRVSPPHCSSDFGVSSARRRCRKLILRSIPSFPSLNTKD